ncbi:MULTISPECIES: hypothetical protein [unclassified Nostoc]|uniref:hypothetical protein n=1 Tax=unclassified Nostoc TaxID=2593658 RepID=UPI0011B046DF|nr:hypothetical protein [Nostoc sp. 'Peltigera membranacea cyanobiont' N6]
MGRYLEKLTQQILTAIANRQKRPSHQCQFKECQLAAGVTARFIAIAFHPVPKMKEFSHKDCKY